MTVIAPLIGIIIGYALIELNNRRRDARLAHILRSQIANTNPPTTAELNVCPYPCPRCGSSDLRGHASTERMGLTCNVCGWIRYTDLNTHILWDALTQPPWTTAAPR